MLDYVRYTDNANTIQTTLKHTTASVDVSNQGNKWWLATRWISKFSLDISGKIPSAIPTSYTSKLPIRSVLIGRIFLGDRPRVTHIRALTNLHILLAESHWVGADRLSM
jgi:hypothetical protein